MLFPIPPAPKWVVFLMPSLYQRGTDCQVIGIFVGSAGISFTDTELCCVQFEFAPVGFKKPEGCSRLPLNPVVVMLQTYIRWRHSTTRQQRFLHQGRTASQVPELRGLANTVSRQLGCESPEHTQGNPSEMGHPGMDCCWLGWGSYQCVPPIKLMGPVQTAPLGWKYSSIFV